MMSGPEADTVDLDNMTKAKLLQYAADHGIDGVTGSMTKAEILAVIREAIA